MISSKADYLAHSADGTTPAAEALRGRNIELLARMMQFKTAGGSVALRPDTIVQDGFTLAEQALRLGHVPTKSRLWRIVFGERGLFEDFGPCFPYFLTEERKQSLLLHAVTEHHGAVVEYLAGDAANGACGEGPLIDMSSDTFRAIVAHMCVSKRPFVSKARMMMRIMRLWPKVGRADLASSKASVASKASAALSRLLRSTPHIDMLVNDIYVWRALGGQQALEHMDACAFK